MKLLSVAVPCYNSQDYLQKCVDSLLPGGDRLELILVDDGSTDGTPAIIDGLAVQYPGVIRAVHQPNGGHGAAVMAGLAAATGEYFKVVDSDDWVDSGVLYTILDTLQGFDERGRSVDLFISNYVYDKAGKRRKKVMRYANALPQGRVFGWDEVGDFRAGQYLLMHSAIYNTAFLRGCGLYLPRHTFYVDELYIYTPLVKVRTMYYLDESFYHYFIGRADQSVNERVMISRIDQQIAVDKLMLEQVDLSAVADERKQRYMLGYLEIITIICSVLLIRAGTEESLEKKVALWEHIEENDPWTFERLRRRPMGRIACSPSRAAMNAAKCGYWISRKVFGFN